MLRPQDFTGGKEKIFIKMLCIGGSGVGKTHLAATFPKSYFLITEPNGEDTFLTKPELAKNVTGFVRLLPQDAQDTKRIFTELDVAVTEAKELAKKGEVETLVLDNFTFLSENRWIYTETFEKEIASSGAQNTLVMYGKLARWCYQFTLMQMLTFPGNVVINCHETLESDEILEKKPDKSCPVLPNILGGFRDKIEGMFSFVVFLSKIKGNDSKYHFMVRTNKGNMRNAKSRISLPEVIEDISYQKLTEVINQTVKPTETK